MVKQTNPFVVQGYVDDAYFCDRQAETTALLQAFDSKRNVTLISLRRMGKSGLIHHVFNRISAGGREVRCFYVDLLHTSNLGDFINALASAIFGQLDTPVEKLYHTVASVLKRCRPLIAPDAVSGMPTLSISVEPGQEQHTLAEIFAYLQRSDKEIYIALDEFQQIAEYPEPGVEALLRSHIQQSPGLSFIFAGSRKHLMQQMFTFPARPFYQSTQTLYLQPIDPESYYRFAAGHFAAVGRELQREAFDHIYSTVLGHTWYVQYWLNRLYDTANPRITTELASEMLEAILNEEDETFYTYSRLMSAAQLRVARGIAAAGVLVEPYSAETAAAYNLPAVSTTRGALKALVDKELAVDDRANYTIYNRFFMLWLRRQSRNHIR